MSILKTVGASKAARVGVALGLAGAALVGIVGSESAQAATVKATVAPTTTSTAGGAVLSITGSGFKTAAGVAVADTVRFSTAACTADATAGTGSAAATFVSATRVVATTPALALTGGKATAYNVCVLDDNTPDVLLATGTVTAYPVATLDATTPIVPAAGPGYGGQAVTVTGTNFTAKTTAKLNGQPLTNIKVAKDGLSFTAVTPADSTSGAVDLTVTTEGGTVTANGVGEYTYSRALTVSPTTGLRTAAQEITVKGKGFSALTFGAAAADAHVRVVQGAYVDTSNEGTDCAGVQVLSDTELVCTIAANSIGANGAYTITVVNTTAAAPTFQTVVSSPATYTAAAF
jgi:hypothetical protein